MSLILTKAALALKNAESNFQVVKFEAHKPKKKQGENNQVNKPIENSKKDLDLKKIRHEIVKFGMSGFDPNKKEEAKIALAVSLGQNMAHVYFFILLLKNAENKLFVNK